eukprot:TRINITY_DN2077_c0_g1_i1.p1 TRINITY_DN2077_c0_g1~~TRINITY_DN2077_c0_g1_i1.p1  ORF type:complete len:150 (+),score=14.04 TRINITY_DN2077_c0_g1_i1:389-838(+)
MRKLWSEYYDTRRRVFEAEQKILSSLEFQRRPTLEKKDNNETRSRAENTLFRAAEQDKSLISINQTAAQAESVGVNIRESLLGQRSTIMNAKTMTLEVESDLQKTIHLTNELSRREQFKRISLASLVVLLALVDVFLMVMKFRRMFNHH